MTLTARFVLPPDVAFVPIEALPPDRRRFLWNHGDVAITRARTRVASRVVASDAAELLREFRSPSTIVDAVLRFSRMRGADPEATLVESYPLVAALVDSGVLVREGAREAREIAASLAPGDVFRGWTIVATVQVLDDTELYHVRRGDTRAALKLGRKDFTRERIVLERIGGLLDAGDDYLLMEWCRGVDAVTAAQTDDRRTLAANIAYAFAALHECGVVHGDVHPRNVLVDRDGTVRLIDFGQACFDGEAPARAGVAFYFEPELASALRAGAPAPMPTERGEQYAVAAMLWTLVAGEHYLDFSLEREELLRQIANEAPRRSSMGALEDVLRVALRKDSTERYATMRELANAIADVPDAVRRAARPTRISESNPYALYLLALERGDPELLAEADVASTQALEPQDEVSNVVHALIAAARGDTRTAAKAIRDFARVASILDRKPDRVGGLAGSLRATTVLLEQEPSLRELGDALHHRMWTLANASTLQHGMAHGWAGILDASLRWSLATVEPPDPRVRARLDQLREEAIPVGRGARWRWNGQDSIAGWCNGSAGFVQLWLTAHEVLRDDVYAALAEDAAWHTWESQDDDRSHCCGPAARAHALHAMHQHTSDRLWRDRAQTLEDRVRAGGAGSREWTIAML